MHNNHRTLNIGLIVAGALPSLVSLIGAISMLSIAWPDLTMQQRSGFSVGLLLTMLPGFAAAAVGFWYLMRQQLVPVKILISLAVAVAAGVYLYLRYVHVSITVAEWIFDQGDYMTLIFSAVIPIFYFVLFYLATHFQISSQRNLVANIIAAIALPVVAYISFNVFRNFFGTGIGADLQQMYLIGLTTVFSFVMLRLLLHVASKHTAKLAEPGVNWSLRLVFIGVLPLVGLLLNAYGPVARESQMVLGNFNAPEFWLLAAFNALVYLLPDSRHRALFTLCVVARLSGFVFVLYFCVVFLLYVPLALLLIAAIGLGFLLLIPYFAAAMQLMRLKKDFVALKAEYSNARIFALAVAGLSLLPALVLTDTYLDRLMLVRAIEYVQHAPLSVNQQPNVNARKIIALTEKRAAKPGRQFMNDAGVPIYDRLYRNIVLDGAEISEALRSQLRLVLLGEKRRATAQPPASVTRVRVADVTVQKNDKGMMAETVLRIRIKNEDLSRNAELDTYINLPDNVFLSQHWLTIDGVEVPAQITTRSLALWVYNRVTERMRDPSLIYYEKANLLRWKVFPVPAAGFRDVRLHFTHAGDATLNLGGRVVNLAGKDLQAPLTATTGDYALLPAAKLHQLGSRTPYLHYIVDCSADAGTSYAQDAEIAARYLGLNNAGARISYVNSGITTQALSPGNAITCPENREGFFLELALRALIYEQMTKADYPVFVVLTQQPPFADWHNLSYLMPYYGDSDGFLQVSAGKAQTWSFAGQPRADRPRLRLPVRKAGDRYFAPAARLVAANVAGEKNNTIDGAAHHHRFVLGDFGSRPRAVVAALQTGVLNAATGSIVLETEAQRLKLSELHKKMLNAKNELDTGERARMSEPSSWLLLVLLLPAWFMRKKMRRTRSEF
ncbi:MSEP-CTERM sorting domain-containing protein [Turneriella parva]|uniref:VIT domain-containing protein n=1 Tax=Turneriella parva (strain ATCC BAA-1111 / DSM 21527 / NCTC 11395 / H) TaxID=869212 RepID=I4B2C2_TURPD|nr:MSEP-CTERM sorting domain-containing protein [Turneriella parva]AFM11429.1 hypothetical protein Turpa_0778 [Turneriella parva DSM 21527]